VGFSFLIGECPEAVFASYLIRFRPFEALDSRYLSYFLQSPEYWQQIAKSAVGIALQNVNAKKLAAIDVPVAPGQEQKRIVAEIEKQFTRLEAAVAALKRVQANLKRYRAAVLKAAVEGRLVPTEAELARQSSTGKSACATGGRAYEPASELLKRILAERRARWEADQLAKFRTSGKESKDGKWGQKYKEPAGPDTTNLPSLPEGWCWAIAEQLSDETRAITYGVIKLGEDLEDGIPTLRSSDVRHLRLILDGVKKISPQIAQNYRRTFLTGGELLITVRGTLGGVVVVPETCRGYNISREVAMLALVDKDIGPTLAFFVASSQLQNWLTQHTKGIAYTGINIETLKQLPIPVPPKKEQDRIAAEVERRLSVIDELEMQVDANLKRAERLRQAILKRAFQGKLVPQNPDDEPASILLERMRAARKQRAEENAKTKGRTGRSACAT